MHEYNCPWITFENASKLWPLQLHWKVLPIAFLWIFSVLDFISIPPGKALYVHALSLWRQLPTSTLLWCDHMARTPSLFLWLQVSKQVSNNLQLLSGGAVLKNIYRSSQCNCSHKWRAQIMYLFIYVIVDTIGYAITGEQPDTIWCDQIQILLLRLCRDCVSWQCLQ